MRDPQHSAPRALAFALSSLLLLGACREASHGPLLQAHGHQSPVYGGTLLFADDEDVRTLDPAIGYDVVSWCAEHLLFDQLLAYDDDLKLGPGLAESYEISPDGTVYTFHLRKGVRFHNGREMTSADVRYSIERLFSPDVASPGASFLGGIVGAEEFEAQKSPQIAGLKTPDPYTVVFTIKEPDRTFLNVISMPFCSIIPKEEVERLGSEWKFQAVGTGPFKLPPGGVQKGVKLTFVANRDYWNPKLPYVDKIELLVNYPRELQFLKFEAAELHHVYRIQAPDYLWVAQQPAWAPYLMVVPQFDTFGILMNNEIPPFDNKKFRQAVALGFDREKMRKLASNLAVVADGYLPPGLPGYEEVFAAGREWQTYNPEKAKKLLAEAGYPNGYPDEIEYMTIASDEKYALSLQSDLAAIGIKIKIKKVSFAEYLTVSGKRKEVAFSYSSWVQDFPDPFDFLDVKFSSANISEENSSNDSFYSNPEVDKLLVAARREMDPEKRLDFYKKAHAIIAEDAPNAFEYHSVQPELVQPFLKNYRPNAVWTRDFTDVWLDLPGGRPNP
jgi:peptide/nickel transport system substrate-binding protein/oligopeptide transport system substrate-binding protein